MKIIIKTFINDKFIKRYLLIFAILMILLLTLNNLKEGLYSYVRNFKNSEIYRTITVQFNNNFADFNNVKEETYIIKMVKIEDSNNERENYYKIILNDQKYVDSFIKDYEEKCSSIHYEPFIMPKMYQILNTSITIVVIIFIIIAFVMLSINIVETITSRKKEISFYKLIGYKNKYIFKYLLSILIFIYIFIFLICNIISFLLSTTINKIFSNINIPFCLYLFSTKFSLFTLIIVIATIIAVVYICYINSKKISPMEFIRNT